MQPSSEKIVSCLVSGLIGSRSSLVTRLVSFHSLTRFCLLGMAGLGMLLASAGDLCAQSALQPVNPADVFSVSDPKKTYQLSLTERFSNVIKSERGRISRVDGFDPAIISVMALKPDQIRVQAVAPGVTVLTMTDEFDKIYTIEVFVEGDVRHLQAYIERFYPDSSVKAVKVKDSVVLRGVVGEPGHISQITEVAEQFFPKVINQMQFGANNQVRLQVRIMEAQRSRIRELGFNWSLLTSSGSISSAPANISPTIEFGIVSGSTMFTGFLEALKRERLLKVLVETTVVADSGRPASLLSGGEFPFPVPQTLGTNTIEWKEYGVKLEAVPILVGNGQVVLEIAPEFSERDFSNAVTIGGETVAGLMTRKANTQVRMKLGQTLMIGGLITTRYTAETHKIPLLGELPGVGMAFRHVKYDENETELIILVTPEYVAPLNAHQVPEGGPGQFTTVPVDRELYWSGHVEVPNYGGPTPPGAGHGHEMSIPGSPVHGPEAYLPQMPYQSAPGQQAPSTPSLLPPQPVLEEGPAPYESRVTPSPLPPMSSSQQFKPTSPTPPAVPPLLPPGSNPVPQSSTPLLPVLPPSNSERTSVEPISNTRIQEIGNWQRSGERTPVQHAVGQIHSSNQTQRKLTVSTEIHTNSQPVNADYSTMPPALINPASSGGGN